MFRKVYFALAASAIAFPALAAEKAIEYDTARLDDPAYVAALYEEIETAAHEVCREELRYSTDRHYMMNSCVEDAIAEAVAEVGSPMLTAAAEDPGEAVLAASQ